MRRTPSGWDATAVTVRCIIVDDSLRFLKAASARLERPGVEVVGTATTSDEAVDTIGLRRPDVVLVDISLGTESGFELAHRLAERSDPPLVVLISTREEADYAPMIAASPAVGFIPKSRLSVEALRELTGL
jgi:DNA-binding NarL/FixJ family response regulator